MSAAIVMGWKYGDMIPDPSRKFFGWALLPYLGFSIISGLMGTNVDNWSHLGGLLAGITLMTMLDPEVLPIFEKSESTDSTDHPHHHAGRRAHVFNESESVCSAHRTV